MLDRTIAPDFSKSFSFALPRPEIESLSGGFDFVFLPGLQQDIVKLEIVFNAGKWYEPKLGAAYFVANLLDKGTATKSSADIAGTFDYYGAQLEISPGYDFVSISLYSLKKYLHEILPLFIEIITSPTFSPLEFDLQKEIFIQSLRVNNQKNSFVASQLMRKNIFGAHHPYGNSVDENDVEALTVDDLKNFFRSHFSPREIYAQGNFNATEIDWVAQQFSFLQSTKVTEPTFAPHANRLPVFHAMPKSVQTSVRLGKQMIGQRHPDYFHLILLNQILGGYFGSRLMKNIREEKGLTYGIYSSLNPLKNDCMFSIGADVNKDNKELTLIEINKELELLRTTLISDDELVMCKNHFLGSLQVEIANPFSTFDKIKSVRLNQLNENYYATLFSSIQSTTSSQLLTTAEKYFNPDSLLEVSVG